MASPAVLHKESFGSVNQQGSLLDYRSTFDIGNDTDRRFQLVRVSYQEHRVTTCFAALFPTSAVRLVRRSLSQ